MKKINNKGFMLAEIIIVSSIIITTMVGLYTGFSNTYKAYERINSYYDVNTTYALKNMENFLMDEMILNEHIGSADNFYKEINNSIDENDYHKKYIDNFIATYEIDKLYLVKYKKAALTELKNDANVDDDFDKYIDFTIEKIEGESEDKSPFNPSIIGYILITKTNKETYSSLRIINKEK